MGSRRHRVAASAVIAAAVLLGAYGASAFWSAEAIVDGLDVESGVLDVTLNGQLTGPGGAITVASINAADLVPGESVAYEFSVGNAGSVPLVYVATGTASGALAASLRFSLYPGGTAANSGTAAAADRTGTCSGTPTAADVTLGGTSTVVITDQELAVGADQTVCIRVLLAADTPTSAQGQTATAAFVADASNVGATP